ncbi:YsnF/AvaK domain-containing protein [Klebsiella pneumoniae]|uniref:YsnF/AvaK domain-containing protein n=1 Tax=Klebsiella pneumoniae TaxID=573 RepID=UPI001E5DF79A|nr:YsnF/AvaK domain-containing protein [Klebsiella pneumoniae]MCC4960255.1 YsnF/AvaK domain-containing protein [Klebsiella pneumoniae]
MAHEKIVTAFNQLQQAEAAKEKLIAEGIAENHIDIISGERLRVEGKEIRHPSFWQRLFGDDVDDDYATEYNKAIQGGGVLLTVRAPKDDADRIEALLDQYSSDYSASYNRAGTGAAVTGSDNREALKLAEEEVAIGKRQVSDGVVRLRRYTVEDEVAEDVSLFEQHADVFRTAVDEPAYLSDVDWSEKTIEVEESHEVPTVSKTARIKEEVGVRNETSERVETVKDTVRRQEVEVEQTGATGLEKDRLAGTTGLEKDGLTGTTDLEKDRLSGLKK